MSVKKCPYCNEEIFEDAIKCKYCGSNIKKLNEVWYRNLPGRQFLGVCTLLAYNFHLPVTLVRLIFILLSFISLKWIILFYFALSFVIPYEKDQVLPIQRFIFRLKNILRNLVKDVKIKNVTDVNNETIQHN